MLALIAFLVIFQQVCAVVAFKYSTNASKTFWINSVFQSTVFLGAISLLIYGNIFIFENIASLIFAEVFFFTVGYIYHQELIKVIHLRSKLNELQMVVDSFPGAIALKHNSSEFIVASKCGEESVKEVLSQSPLKIVLQDSDGMYADVNICRIIQVKDQRWVYGIVSASQGADRFLIYLVPIDNIAEIVRSGHVDDSHNLQGDSNEDFAGAYAGLISGLSHELNNLVTIISARSFQGQMLLNKSASLGKQDSLEKIFSSILKEGERLKQVVQSFRKFGEARFDETSKNINLGEVIAEMSLFFEVRLRNYGVGLIVDQNFRKIELKLRPGSFELAFFDVFFRVIKIAVRLPEAKIVLNWIEQTDRLGVAIAIQSGGFVSKDESVFRALEAQLPQALALALKKNDIEVSTLDFPEGAYLFFSLPRSVLSMKKSA